MLTNTRGTDRLTKIFYILTQSYSDFNFFTRIPDYNFYSLARLDLLLSCNTSISSTVAFPPLRNFQHWKTGLLKLQNLPMLIKQTILLVSRYLALKPSASNNYFSEKINLLFLFSLMVIRSCILHLIKQFYSLKSFYKLNFLRPSYVFTWFLF